MSNRKIPRASVKASSRECVAIVGFNEVIRTCLIWYDGKETRSRNTRLHPPLVGINDVSHDRKKTKVRGQNIWEWIEGVIAWILFDWFFESFVISSYEKKTKKLTTSALKVCIYIKRLLPDMKINRNEWWRHTGFCAREASVWVFNNY